MATFVNFVDCGRSWCRGGTIDFWIDVKLLHVVGDDPLRRLEKPGCARHISAGIFQGVNDQLLFKIEDVAFKGS